MSNSATAVTRSLLPKLLAAAALLGSWLAAAPGTSAAPSGNEPGIAEHLRELGGTPCPNGSDFTCVTISVPLDHFEPADTRTIDVVFAVLPATGRSKGLFVTATGGPGSAGISYADSYTSAFAPGIRRRFDVVFFDQRGIGLSGGLACTDAATAYYRSLAPPVESASRFSADCVAEMGSPSILPYVGTDQAVEDLEAFRQAVGAPRVWLYGESYGTQYAQTYAAAHPDALGGLVLDGVVDLTLTGPQFWEDAAGAFERVLDGTLASCDRRKRCRADARGSAEAVYDGLRAELAARSVPVRFPLPAGGWDTRELTSADLTLVASGQVYSEDGRMLLQRAIAAAGRGDLVPLLRLAYANLYVDPETLEPIEDPSYSTGMYYGVDCQDYSYYDGSQTERAAAFLAEGERVGISHPRLGEAVFLSDLPCVFWPGASPPPARPAPLRAEGIPTLVLVAAADPITPAGQGEAVYSRLADGYLITTKGGPHVTFGRGNACPDEAVTRFIVQNAPPGRRRTVCAGQLVAPYVPLAPIAASSFTGPRAGFVAAERELGYLPEYYYWDGTSAAAAGCPVGGGFVRFQPAGDGVRLSLRSCGFTRGFVMTGRGRYDYGSDRFALEVRVVGRFAGSYRFVRDGSTVTLERR